MLPLAGKTIVLTRAESDADSLQGRLEALGAAVCVVPSIRFERLSRDAAMAAALTALPSTAWIAFASPRGVTFFAALLEDAHRALPPQVRLATVGPSTAEAVEAHLRAPAHLVATPSTAEGLAAALMGAAQPADGPILLPAAREGRPVLAATLRAAGFAVTHLPLYVTRIATAADGPVVLPAAVDYVLFTSPSTVSGFLARMPVLAAAQLVSIGPTTSAAIRQSGLRVAREAISHNLDGLVEALTRET